MKKILIAILSVVLLMTGCENMDFGDTNKNVNGPSDPNTASLLSGGIMSFATRTGRPYRITPTLNVQYFMQLVYNDEMLYANYPGYWSSYYVQRLSNMQAVINICSDPETAADPLVIANGDPVNQLAVAMIFKSVIFKRVTDLFGDVPYAEALDVELTLTPAYSSQEDIYAGMIADVTAARNMINTGTAGPTGDPIYDGDMDSWVRFANSFLMSLAMQLTESGTTAVSPSAVFNDALGHAGGVIEDVSQEAWYTFDIANGFNNPWAWMRSADYGVTEEMVSSMKGAGDNKTTTNTIYDDRLAYIMADTSQTGLPYGYLDYDENQADVNPNFISSETSLPIMQAGYVWLHRAEAAERGWTAEVVNDMITNGILASWDSFEALYSPGTEISIPAGNAALYAAGRVADVATAPGGALQVIGEEKWIAMFPLGYDAWSEWRRSDYPILFPAPDAINDGDIARRYNYPSDESTLNSANYQTGVSGLSPAQDINTARMWWDK